MKNTTIIQQQKAAISFHQSRVCDLLQWQPERLSLFMYNTGQRFLLALFGNDTGAIAILEKEAAFWNWWRNEWNNRDEAWLHHVDGREDEMALDYRNKLYRVNHSAEVLACELTIPRTVYPENFTTIKIEM